MSEEQTKKPVVIVTGATRGLGKVLAERLLDANYMVIGTGRSETAPLSWPDNKNLHYRRLDLGETSGHQAFVKAVVAEFGNIYGLVNNGALGQGGVLGTMHVRDIEQLISVNLTGTIILTKYATRSMLLGGEGRVINVSSIIGSTGFNGLSVYGATKSGLIGFARSLARELGRANITVNCVSPGYMETDMSASVRDVDLEKIVRRSPMNDLAKPEDVAEIVSLLLSTRGKRITGVNYTVDAGSTI